MDNFKNTWTITVWWTRQKNYPQAEATPQAAGTLLRIDRVVENVEVDDVVTQKIKKRNAK